MDRQVRRLAFAFLVLFVLLFAQLNYIQVFAADRLKDNPANTARILRQEYEVRRGQILARDRATVLAASRETGGKLKFRRIYRKGALYAHVTGFYSIVFGRSGLEASYNDYLAGTAAELLPQKLVDDILGRERVGATVVSTIDHRLQQVAAQQLGSHQGGVVAMDPRTGEILAMYSNPTFDPNPLAAHDQKRVRAAWKGLLDDPARPLLSRAAQELFPPGSTFKVVTTAAALESGLRPDSTFDNPHRLDLPQTDRVLRNFGDDHCLGGAPRITIAQALQVSCNVAFGEIGLDVGADALVAGAEAFGFNQDVEFDIPFEEGSIPEASAFENDLPGVAYSAIGQQSVGANPLQMAMIASAIGNGGVALQPRLVAEIRDPSGRVIRTFRPEATGEPMSPETAAALTRMMVSVVESGTATGAQIPGVEVAGKTGTAQHGAGDPHAWFVSFAPADDPQVAVAVVVLNGGSLGSEATGGAVAAPIAKAVIEAALGR